MPRRPAETPSTATRRDFVAKTTAAAATAAIAIRGVHTQAADPSPKSAGDRVRIGLVGAGGRGAGAVLDSLSINENVQLVAVADFDEQAPGRLIKNLQRRDDSKVNVASDKLHTGLDAYKRILDDSDIDVVLFATPPGFRPRHVLEAVQAGKHVFAEKPTCVDPAGYRVCLEADALAREKGTCIVTGTQYRRQANYVDVMREIHAGAIGDVVGATSRYCSSGIWFKTQPAGMSDTEYQIRNWMHYIWLSGDQIAEQAVHNIDVMNWLMQGPPESAFGSGGRFTRPDGSEMWDSMSIDYLYPGRKFISFKCRQIPDAQSSNETIVYGTNGSAKILGFSGGSLLYDRDGNQTAKFEGDIGLAYQQEHKDLVDAVRAGQPIVEFAETANSSLTAVMGRMAAYTGQLVSWDFVTEQSTLDLFPNPLDLSAAREPLFAIPGKVKLV